MVQKLIGRGIFAGLVAGLGAYIFARIFVEPLVSRGIGYEAARGRAEQSMSGVYTHDHEVFTRSVQENIGAGVGSIVFGLVMGALFAVACTLLWMYFSRRQLNIDPRVMAIMLAAGGFVSVYLVPFAAYPANPPGVGDADTIGDRSSSYLIITVLSVVFAVAAVLVSINIATRVGNTAAMILGGVMYLVAVWIVIALLPSFNEVPGPLLDGNRIVLGGFPAEVLADFRFYSVINQVIFWSILGIVFSLLVTRLTRRRRSVGGDSLRARESFFR